MKCPKCGYVGFESTDKCRNCGYHFSLAETTSEVDLSLDADASFVPPADFDFRTGDTPLPVSRGRTPAPNTDFDLPPRTPQKIDTRPPGSDLPLFGLDGGDGPLLGVPAGTTPAAVPARRKAAPATPSGITSTPTLPASGPRLRPRTAPQPRLATLSLEPEPLRELPLPGSRPTSGPRPAGGGARAIAALLDALILGGLNLAVLYFTLRVCRLAFADIVLLPPAPFAGFLLLIDGAYLVAFIAHGGQTIGKMATSIRVVGDDGSGVGAAQAMARAAGYAASVLSAGLGFVPGLFGPARRALHDRVANTRVIKI